MFKLDTEKKNLELSQPDEKRNLFELILLGIIKTELVLSQIVLKFYPKCRGLLFLE